MERQPKRMAQQSGIECSATKGYRLRYIFCQQRPPLCINSGGDKESSKGGDEQRAAT